MPLSFEGGGVEGGVVPESTPEPPPGGGHGDDCRPSSSVPSGWSSSSPDFFPQPAEVDDEPDPGDPKPDWLVPPRPEEPGPDEPGPEEPPPGEFGPEGPEHAQRTPAKPNEAVKSAKLFDVIRSSVLRT
jgi:hypothetical protein